MADRKTIGKRLRTLRGKRIAAEVANACKISTSALSMYENGERIPRDEIKVALAQYYNQSVESIFFTP